MGCWFFWVVIHFGLMLVDVTFVIPCSELSLDKEYHDTLLALHHQVTVEFAKRHKEMKERIRCGFHSLF